MIRSGTFEEAVFAAIENYMGNVYTAIPCRVIAVRTSQSGAMVDIQPTINQRFRDGSTSPRSPILGVPVSFPVSSNAGVIFPVGIGTTGLAVFSMRSMDSWKGGDGGNSTPTNFAKFDKSDAVFFPGIQPPREFVGIPSKHAFGRNLADVVVFNNLGSGQENEIRLAPNGNVAINTNQDVNINCANFNVNASGANFNIGNTSWSGDYSGSGTFTFNGVVFETHVHGTSPPPSN